MPGNGSVLVCGVHFQRQLRLRVIEALEQRLKQFTSREELWPLRVPREPLLLDDLIGRTLGDDRDRFDVASLRSRPLLRFEWPDGSAWEAWVIVLPSKLKAYCDTSDDESRVLASGGKNEGDESDRVFLELLADSAGGHFGIEMSGGPPSRVRTAIDRAFVVTFFVNLFEVMGLEEDVRSTLTAGAPERRRGRRDDRRFPARRRGLARAGDAGQAGRPEVKSGRRVPDSPSPFAPGPPRDDPGPAGVRHGSSAGALRRPSHLHALAAAANAGQQPEHRAGARVQRRHRPGSAEHDRAAAGAGSHRFDRAERYRIHCIRSRRGWSTSCRDGRRSGC